MNTVMNRTKYNMSGLTFVVVSALFITLFHNSLFFSKSWHIIQSDSVHDVLFSLSMPVLLFALLNIIFSVLLLPFIRKPIVILFLLTGAAINYFMYSFNIVIDGDMVENALETNTHEVIDLITFKMGIWVLLLGIVPAILVYKIKINPEKSYWKSGLGCVINIVISIALILLIAAFFYKDYASLFRNNRILEKMLVPSNVIAGVVKVVNSRIDANRPFVEIGTDAKKGDFILRQPKKTLVVLVVGETARAENFSLGGYKRETNPRF